MDIDDILVPKSLRRPEKDVYNVDKICSGGTSSKVPDERDGKQTHESLSDKLLQSSSKILELEIDDVREKDICNIPLEFARFTIEKTNKMTERRGINCASNNAKLEREPVIKIRRQIKPKKSAKIVTTKSQIQTRGRYVFQLPKL